MDQYKLQADSELIGLMRDGDDRALVEIYERYWDKILAVAYNRLGNLEEAEECVQDVMYKLWKLRDDFALAKVDLANYLARAIRNQAFNILDSRHRQRVRSESYVPVKDVDLLSPERQLLVRELQKQIDDSIRSLPPQCQLVFKLSRQEGLSTKEIADTLHLSENTIKSHLKKASKSIQDNIKLATSLVFLVSVLQK